MCTSLDNMTSVSLVITTLFSLAQAISFCSLNDTNVLCLSCSEICTSTTKTCFTCPDNCNHSCDSVCSPWCLQGTCHYQRGQLMCSQGCKDGRTGISCQEFCLQDCQICDQFTTKCKKFKSNPPKSKTKTTSSERRWLVIGPVLAAIAVLITTAGLCYKGRRAFGCVKRPLTIQTLHMAGDPGHRPAEQEDVPGNIYVERVQVCGNTDQVPAYAIPDFTQSTAIPDFTQSTEDKEKYKYLTPVPQNLS